MDAQEIAGRRVSNAVAGIDDDRFRFERGAEADRLGRPGRSKYRDDAAACRTIGPPIVELEGGVKSRQPKGSSKDQAEWRNSDRDCVIGTRNPA